MGPRTGKVLDYETRNKRCSQCEVNERTGNEKEHDCRKNHSQSSKAMEGDIAVSLFQRSQHYTIKYETLIGDDDSTTISWIHAQVDSDVKKISDVNHATTALHKQLASIQRTHKQLTRPVIDYVKRCFSYAIAQNTNDPDGLRCALDAIPGHMFGDHTSCGMSWCGFVQRLGPNLPDAKPYRHSSLRGGSDLTSEDLKQGLTAILRRFSANAEKLAPRGSSQRNESLNSTIVSKTTKTRHYGGTAQNDYRVSAGIAQKNLSYDYIPGVMRELGMSPGKNTVSHAQRMCRKRTLECSYKELPSFKRRRLRKKAERAGKTAAAEVIEGNEHYIQTS